MRVERIAELARCACLYNSVSVVKVIHVRIVESDGLYVVTSPGVPARGFGPGAA